MRDTRETSIEFGERDDGEAQILIKIGEDAIAEVLPDTPAEDIGNILAIVTQVRKTLDTGRVPGERKDTWEAVGEAFAYLGEEVEEIVDSWDLAQVVAEYVQDIQLLVMDLHSFLNATNDRDPDVFRKVLPSVRARRAEQRRTRAKTKNRKQNDPLSWKEGHEPVVPETPD